MADSARVGARQLNVPGGLDNSDVTVSFTCADNPGEPGAAVDTVAGATISGIHIDLTAPVVAVTG